MPYVLVTVSTNDMKTEICDGYFYAKASIMFLFVLLCSKKFTGWLRAERKALLLKYGV